MIDISETTLAKSDQLNADDLIGTSITVKVSDVSKGTPESPIKINYEGDNGKPFLPCKTMRRVLMKAWGKDGKKYIGKSMTLYRDDKVKYAGQEVGGVRISHMSDIEKALTMVLAESKMSKKPYTVNPLKVAEQPQKLSKAVTDKLVKAGDAAAKTGVDGYKEWIAGLSADEKEAVRGNSKRWSETAKTADTEVEEVEDEPNL